MAAGGTQAWPLRVKRVVVRTASSYRDDPPETTTAETLLEPVGAGLVRVRTTDTADGSSSDATSLYGFVEAATVVRSGAHRARRVVTEFSANRPITSLVPGGTFSFRQEILMIEDEKLHPTLVYRTACRIGRRVPASTLNKSLTGDAITTDCTTTVDGRAANKRRGYLLPGLGWYFQESF